MEPYGEKIQFFTKVNIATFGSRCNASWKLFEETNFLVFCVENGFVWGWKGERRVRKFHVREIAKHLYPLEKKHKVYLCNSPRKKSIYLSELYMKMLKCLWARVKSGKVWIWKTWNFIGYDKRRKGKLDEVQTSKTSKLLKITRVELKLNLKRTRVEIK